MEKRIGIFKTAKEVNKESDIGDWGGRASCPPAFACHKFFASKDITYSRPGPVEGIPARRDAVAQRDLVERCTWGILTFIRPIGRSRWEQAMVAMDSGNNSYAGAWLKAFVNSPP